MKHILERKADFEAFKNEAQLIEKTCNTIQSSISLWKEYLENMLASNQWLCESESNSYHWLILDGLKSIISMNPYEYLLSEQSRTKKKSLFLIDNKQHLCEHGGLHPMTARKGKYIPDNVYTSMKYTFNKKLQSKSVLGFDPSEEITHFNNHDISYKNMRCGDCIK